jgi:hypothetical protein
MTEQTRVVAMPKNCGCGLSWSLVKGCQFGRLNGNGLESLSKRVFSLPDSAAFANKAGHIHAFTRGIPRTAEGCDDPKPPIRELDSERKEETNTAEAKALRQSMADAGPSREQEKGGPCCG